MRNIFFLTLSLLICTQASAQQKNLDKARRAYGAMKLESAMKAIDKCLEHKDTKKDPAVFLLKSKIMFAISNDPVLLDKHQNALKEAVKYAEKSIAYITSPKDLGFSQENADFFKELQKKQNKEAIEAYHLGKYAKALPMFKKSMLFGEDTQSLVYAADCYWNMGNRPESLPLFKRAAEMIYAAVLDSNSGILGYHKEPFRKLCIYFIDHEEYDSAYLFVKNGREILPNDPVLNTYTYQLMMHVLNKIPPSEDYLKAVERGLHDFPGDSFLNHRENSIYIYLLNGLAISGEQVRFDSLLMQCGRKKMSKKSLKDIQNIRRYDIFAGLDQERFVREFRDYLALIGLKEACYAAWMSENRILTGKYLPEDISVLQSAFGKEQNILTASCIFEIHLKQHPKDKKYRQLRYDYVTSQNGRSGETEYLFLIPMIQMNDACSEDFPKNSSFFNTAKSLRMRLIEESADSGDFALCRKIWKQAHARYTDQKATLDKLWTRQTELDFLYNYYGSRINPPGKNEPGVPEYTWNGSSDSCKAGFMSQEIISRAERRINYFRRMAGIDNEIILSNQDNEFCMYAAMMCEANRSMSHEPGDGWRCFIPAGADALKTGILSKESNPAIAVTAAMGQNHPTVGNRRWLLNPDARYMGIGTSATYTVIKAIDETATADSNAFKTHFAAWPPEKDCPRMLLFNKWSFSCNLPLEGASVSMTGKNGAPVSMKTEAPVSGYGMNTLVWEPELNMRTIEAGTEFLVTVKLKNGKKFQYTVRITDVKLNR